MSSAKPFFKFSMDETSLHDFFSSAEERFRQYDSLILAQNGKIDGLTAKVESTRSQLNKEQPSINQKVENMMKTIDNIGQEFEKYEKRMLQFEEQLQIIEQQLLNLPNLESELRQAFTKELHDSNSKILQSLDNISNRMGQAEARILSLQEDSNLTSQKIVTLNECVSLNSKESQSLGQKIDNSNQKINSLETEQTKKLAEMDTNMNDLARQIAELKEKVNTPFPVRPPEPDLSLIEMRDVDTFPVTGPASLPKLVRIRKVDDIVRYVYDFVPTLQGILDWSYGELDRLRNSRSTIESDIDRIRDGLCDAKKGIGDMRSTIETMNQEMATREEVSLLMRRKYVQLGESCGSGARCISCGRELPDDFDGSLPGPRRIGTAVAGQASGSTKRMVVGLIENPPRSARGFKPRARKVQFPK